MTILLTESQMRQKDADFVKLQEMLIALEQGATKVIMAAREASVDASEDKYHAYLHFREVVDDFDTLAIVIEYKLKRMRDEKAEALGEKFDELTAFMLSSIVSASLHFLRILSEKSEMPLARATCSSRSCAASTTPRTASRPSVISAGSTSAPAPIWSPPRYSTLCETRGQP